MPLGAIAGAVGKIAPIAGALGGIFGGKRKRVRPEIMEPPQYREARESIWGYLKPRIGRKPEAYPGEFIAPMAPLEERALGRVGERLDAPMPEPFGWAGEEIRKTLAAEYDPATSPFYAAHREQAQRELEEAREMMRDIAAGTGRYFGGVRVEQERELVGEHIRDLAMRSAEMAERERERRLGVVPYAMKLGLMEEEIPGRRIEEAMQYGELPRELEQLELAALYQDWLRRKKEERMYPQMAMDFARTPVAYQYPRYRPSWWERHGEGLTGALGDIGGMFGRGRIR